VASPEPIGFNEATKRHAASCAATTPYQASIGGREERAAQANVIIAKKKGTYENAATTVLYWVR